MKMVLAGGSGFLGSALCWTWAEDGHDIRVLTRGLPAGHAQHESGTGKPGITRVGWTPDGRPGEIARELDGAAAVVNLAGESIAGRRWSVARKQALHDSRILGTRSIVAALGECSQPPDTFISGSAVGYYGPHGSEPLSEDTSPGDDFLSRLCVEWEAEAARVARPGLRLVLLRTGIVLEKDGGALPKMMLPFRFFAGGRLGSGQQYMSWIHRLDWIEMVRWLVDTPTVAGPVNATAPHPVTNADFTRALGRAMHRPALLPAPSFALRLGVGEMAESILTGQRALPARAQAAGYHFRYPEIDIALRGIFGV